MSASRRCCSVVIRRRIFPTLRVNQTDGGTKISEITARCQFKMHIATTAPITVVTFEAIVVAVLVMTLSSPPMSLEIRDCTHRCACA